MHEREQCEGKLREEHKEKERMGINRKEMSKKIKGEEHKGKRKEINRKGMIQQKNKN